MTTMAMKPRRTFDSAKRERFEASTAIPATNTQDAINSVYNTLSTSPPALPTKAVTFAMSPYAVLTTDYVLGVDTSGGAVTINMLPQASRSGRSLEIKDVTGNAAANPISVVMNGAETADGLATYLLDSNYGAARFSPETGGYFVNA